MTDTTKLTQIEDLNAEVERLKTEVEELRLKRHQKSKAVKPRTRPNNPIQRSTTERICVECGPDPQPITNFYKLGKYYISPCKKHHNKQCLINKQKRSKSAKKPIGFYKLHPSVQEEILRRRRNGDTIYSISKLPDMPSTTSLYTMERNGDLNPPDLVAEV